MINFLSNSFKYTRNGKIEVVFSNIQNDENLFEIQVIDTGKGIPENIKPKLFKMFSTHNHDNKSNQRGIGLGLTISSNLIQKIGPTQDVDLQSKVGVGTKIKFKLFKSFTQTKKKIQDRVLDIYRDIGLESCTIKIDDSEYQDEKAKTPRVMKNQNDNPPQISFCPPKDKVDEQQNFILQRSPQSIQLTKRSLQHSKQRQQSIDIFNFSQKHRINIQSNQSIISERAHQRKYSQILSQHQIPAQLLDMKYFTKFQYFTKFFQKNPKILIADDFIFNIQNMRLVLERLGAQTDIYEVYDGQEAIDLMKTMEEQKDFFRIVFMDWDMPICDGPTACKIISDLKKKGEINKNSLVIMCTAYDSQEDENEAYAKGADGFISKPVTIDKIYDICRQIDKKQTNQ